MTLTIDSVYRDYNTVGVPASGDYKPKKSEIRALHKKIQNGGGLAVTRNTYAALTGVTPPSELYMGIVLDDADATKNGYYSRVSGVWVWERGFPDTFAELTVTGGTGNAVIAATEPGVNPSVVRVFFIEPTASNSGAVTLSVNGAAARPVVDVNGDALTAGLFTSGRTILLADKDTEYRILSDPDADGAAAAAAASALEAEAWADTASVLTIPDGSLVISKFATSVTDYFLSFYCANAMEQAEAGGPVFAGPEGNGIFDGFNTLNFIDEANAVHLDTSTIGELRAVAPGFVAPADPTEHSGNYSDFTMGSMSFKVPNSVTVTELGWYQTTSGKTNILKLVKRNSAGNFTVVATATLAHGGTGWEDEALSVPFEVPATGDYYVAGKYDAGNTSNYSPDVPRFHFTGNATGTQTFIEDGGARPAYRATIEVDGGFEVMSDIIATDTPPTWASVFAFVKENGATVNTDLVLALTRDDADFADVTLTAVHARPDGSTSYASGRVDISSLASGTDSRWKFSAASPNSAAILAVGIVLGD